VFNVPAWALTVSGMIQLLATVFKPLWRTFCLNQAAFTPASSPVILLHTFLNVKLVNLSSRNTDRDYVLLILFFVLFTPINAAAKSVTKQLIIPHVSSRNYFRNNILQNNLSVSYTHLTLPTTPYV
jgi:hypothetical protein